MFTKWVGSLKFNIDGFSQGKYSGETKGGKAFGEGVFKLNNDNWTMYGTFRDNIPHGFCKLRPLTLMHGCSLIQSS